MSGTCVFTLLTYICKSPEGNFVQPVKKKRAIKPPILSCYAIESTAVLNKTAHKKKERGTKGMRFHVEKLIHSI